MAATHDSQAEVRADHASSAENTTFSIRFDASPERVLDAVAHVAELWGAEFDRRGTGGHLEAPVAAGLRRGVVEAQVETRGAGGATHLTLRTTKESYQLQTREIMVLLMGAAGGLFMVVVPFAPHLFDLLPMAGILLLLAWFLVVSRVRHRNLRDFLHEVRDELADENAPSG